MNENHSTDELSIPPDLLNPFVHRLELSTTYDKIKTAVLTVVVLPFRVMAIMCLLIMAWVLACVGLMGLSEKELRQQPITGWRRDTKTVICWAMRTLFLCGGFHWVTVKGKQATAKEAPILAVAPHSTFFDALPVVMMGAPTVVAKGETGSLPFFGKLINYTQPVYVWRDDPNSRQNTIKEIIARATSDQEWPQILIFPEGTCTNRSCLITFKQGAFYPGVPIQPVCIRYPNKLDTVTWTWEGPGALKLLWLTLTQVQSSCEIEFLPVYKPSEEEKRDPKLYANNVRLLMAKALDIPVSDYTYDDCRLMRKAIQMNLPFASELVEVQKLRNKLGLAQNNTEEKMLRESPKMISNADGHLSYIEFAEVLKVSSKEDALQQLFKVYDKKSTGTIDFREYLLGALVISKAANPEDMLEIAFKIFDRANDGKITLKDSSRALLYTMSMSAEDVQLMFQQIDSSKTGYITYDQFRSYAQQKTEFAGVFSVKDKVQTLNSKINSRECNNSKKQE